MYKELGKKNVNKNHRRNKSYTDVILKLWTGYPQRLPNMAKMTVYHWRLPNMVHENLIQVLDNCTFKMITLFYTSNWLHNKWNHKVIKTKIIFPQLSTQSGIPNLHSFSIWISFSVLSHILVYEIGDLRLHFQVQDEIQEVNVAEYIHVYIITLVQ
jgi:hypothetical protein